MSDIIDLSLGREDAYKAMERCRPFHVYQRAEDEYTELLDSLCDVLRGMATFKIDEEWWTVYSIYKRYCEALYENPGYDEDREKMRERWKLLVKEELPPDGNEWWGYMHPDYFKNS